MFREMDGAGMPEPEYHIVEFMLYATLKNQKWVENQKSPQVELTNEDKLLAHIHCPAPVSISDPR